MSIVGRPRALRASGAAGRRGVISSTWCALCVALCLLACGSSGEDDGALGSSGTAGTGAGDTSGDRGSAGDARWLQYIRGAEHPRLELELDAVAGLAPNDDASAPVLAALRRHLDKPAGIEVRADGTLDAHAADHVWTFSELSSLADQTFADRSEAGTIAMHMLFVDGHYEDDTDQSAVLGLAWDHRHVAMFKDNIARSCASRGALGVLDPGACARAEAAVWLHEVGHLLGLVDNDLPMARDHRDPDPAHGRHDVDPSCVMYWAYDGEAAVDAVLSNLVGNRGELDFCDTCIADLDAAR